MTDEGEMCRKRLHGMERQRTGGTVIEDEDSNRESKRKRGDGRLERNKFRTTGEREGLELGGRDTERERRRTQLETRPRGRMLRHIGRQMKAVRTGLAN